MVFPATPSPLIFFLMLLLGFLPVEKSATDPFCSELQAAETFRFAVGNSSSAFCSHGGWSQHSSQGNYIIDEQFCGAFTPLSDDLSSDFKEHKEEHTGSEPASGKFRVIGKVSDEIIVRFTAYKHASEHRELLDKSLQWLGGWQWIDRVNPASAFPTDFALLRVEEASQHRVLEQLKRLSFVKDFSRQSQFSRALLKEFETNAEKKWSPRGFDKSSEIESSDFWQNEDESHKNSWKQGKHCTSWTQEGESLEQFEKGSLLNTGRKLLLQRSQITSMFGAEKLWAKGFTGAKVRMAVFDTGVRADHPHFRNIKERTNWTNEDTLNDNLGHGTFVAGVISSQDPQCLGFAPDAEIFAFRVFTDAQVSYTSWFLDAFNYAIATDMNILNLSIGGPDFLDRPFIEKVWEMTANNVIMVSAIGNDGPLYGTLNNPADQSDVIGVGGIDYSDHIASFSSRGMTTWEIPHGYGRVKPDIVAYGRDIIGSKINSGCKSLSGTSVASPVVAGAVCLLASVIPASIRWDIINPASMKQALIEGAARLDGPNIFEQGAGRLNLLESYEILVKYEPRASIVPPAIDFLECPYMWPFCRQPLYAGAMPVIFNVTILNGMGVVGYVEGSPEWKPSDAAGDLLDIHFTFSDVIWPWTGFLGLHLQIRDEGVNFSGIIEGDVSLSIVSPPRRQQRAMQRSECTLHVRVNVIPTPQRERRILWDQFHNVRYPPGYIPRDSLDVRNDILDWHGDHPHTNFHGMFDMLRDAGYYLEILGSPITCFDARHYGTLLMVDLEDEYHNEEIKKLENDVKLLGLGLIVFADWYHVETMAKMKFFDDNTRSWWTPVTGGANVPALNELLLPFGIAFGGTILNGPYSINGERGFFASGTDIARFPDGGFLHRFMFQDSTKAGSLSSSLQTSLQPQVEAAILGAVQVGPGRVAVYGDSNCLDSSHMVTNCYWLLKKLLDFTSHDIKDPVLFAPSRQITFPLNGPKSLVPSRRDDVNFSMYSLVLDHELRCGNDARFEVQGTKGYGIPLPRPLYSFGQRQPMGSSSHAVDDTPSLSLNLSMGDVERNFTSILKDLRTDMEAIQNDLSESKDDGGGFTDVTADFVTEDASTRQNKGGAGRGQKQQQNRKDIGLRSGWLNHDELDTSTLLAVQWLIPILLCIAGFVLIFGLWRMQQKRRKRARKGSTRSLLTF